MKRIGRTICISLCVIMSISLSPACHTSGTPQDTEPAAPDTGQTQSPDTDSATQAGDETADNPGADSPPQSAANTGPVLSGGVVLPNGPLPQGERTPLAAPERYYDNTVLKLIPSVGYGHIWPYIGGYFNSNMGTWSELIGICDDTGRIICDPAYNDVKIIESAGQKLYAFTKNTVNREKERYEDMYITTLTPLDGSWAETYDSVIWGEKNSYELSPPVDFNYGCSRAYQWRDPVNYDYITAKRGGRWGVIGWDGSVLLPFEYIEPVCFHEGLASVLSMDGETYSFIDISGRTILGPYEAPPRPVDEWDDTGGELPKTDKIMFYEGYAKFYEDGKFGIIDHAGNVVVPADYDFITCINGGMAMFVVFPEANAKQMAFERFGIVNSTGNVIVEPTDYNYSYFYMPFNRDGQVVILQIYNPEGDIIAYDGTKTPFEDKTPHYSPDGNDYLFPDSDVALPTSRYFFDIVNDELIIVSDRETRTWRIYNYEGVPVSPENPGWLDHWYNDGQNTTALFINVSPPGGWEWPPPVMIYGLDGTALLDDKYYTVIPIEGRYLVRGKSTAGLVDMDGNYIIKVSIAAYTAD